MFVQTNERSATRRIAFDTAVNRTGG